MFRKIYITLVCVVIVDQVGAFADFVKWIGGASFKAKVYESVLFQKLSSMWSSVQDECQDVELKGTTDWEMPKWAEGVFVTSGPSKHEMNEQRFGHLFDGFGRFSNVKFIDGKAHFTSKMI